MRIDQGSQSGQGAAQQSAQQAAQQAAQTAREAATTARAAADAARDAARDGQGNLSRDEFRNQLRNQIRDAVDAAQNADGEARIITQERGPGGERTVVQLPNGQKLIINGKDVHLDGESSVPFTPDFRNAVPNGAVDIVQALAAMVVFCVVGFPLARAFARWLDRRTAVPKVPAEVMTRLSSIENAVETVAVEVERISEGQRFTAKLLSERAQAEPVAR